MYKYTLPIDYKNFNKNCELPYYLEINHIFQAMQDFINFLESINEKLDSAKISPLETFLMPANFSSIVGEFIIARIPQYCNYLVKNKYHNGHPDLIPKGMFTNDAVQYTKEGIEVKSSRRPSGWQGHNPESVWLIVFHFDSISSNEIIKGKAYKPFCFKGVYAAKLDKEDWNFAGRSDSSRRTITASINQRGIAKLKKNWVYRYNQ
jgi:hypothetical protein